ncbi:MAG: MMPL family transporter, partial [Thermodesulfobacteriota bacterium]|nr:MMPL family transporter [Thermodesulfobacteriota bacterium]
MVKKFAFFIMQHRLLVLGIILSVSAFFGWQCTKIRIETSFSDLLPHKHPFIKVHKKYEKQLGDPLKVYLMLQKKEGDIYNTDTLEKVTRITEKLDSLQSVNHDQVYSIASRKVKSVTVNIGMVQSVPLMDKVPQTKEELEEFRRKVRNTGAVYGVWVSPDEKSVLFTITLIADTLDYRTTFQQIDELIKSESEPGYNLYVCGEPILTGWIYNYQNEMYLIFGLTFLVLIFFLYFYFRNFVGVLVPTISSLLGAVWGLGFCGLLGYSLEPLTLVIPLLITARALSHSVQFTERFFERFNETKDKTRSCIESTVSILPPGILGIATDSIGILLIAVAPIPMLQKLSYFCSFWAASIIFSGLIFTPVFISLFPPPKNVQSIVDTKQGFIQTILGFVARLGFGKLGVANFIIVAILAAFALWVSTKVEIGDVNPGTPILWEDSEYNAAVGQINENFPGTEELFILAEGEGKWAIHNPQLLKILDSFQRSMEKCEGVSYTMSIVDLFTPIQSLIYGGNPKWGVLPHSNDQVGNLYFTLLGSAAPDDFDRYFSGDQKMANIIVW